MHILQETEGERRETNVINGLETVILETSVLSELGELEVEKSERGEINHLH